MSKNIADRYTKIVEWSEEDECYIGRCPELFHGGVHGEDRNKVYAELCQTVDEWISILKGDKKELPPPIGSKKFSGKFILRIDPHLHKLLAIHAMKEGASLNNYVEKKLRDVAIHSG